MRGPPHKIQNTNQSKTKHFHYTRGTVHKGIGYLRINKGNISAKLDSAPLIIIHPIWFTNWKPTELNNIEWTPLKVTIQKAQRKEYKWSRSHNIPSILYFSSKNLNISLLPHNPKYNEANNFPKSLTADGSP